MKKLLFLLAVLTFACGEHEPEPIGFRAAYEVGEIHGGGSNQNLFDCTWGSCEGEYGVFDNTFYTGRTAFDYKQTSEELVLLRIWRIDDDERVLIMEWEPVVTGVCQEAGCLTRFDQLTFVDNYGRDE